MATVIESTVKPHYLWRVYAMAEGYYLATYCRSYFQATVVANRHFEDSRGYRIDRWRIYRDEDKE